MRLFKHLMLVLCLVGSVSLAACDDAKTSRSTTETEVAQELTFGTFSIFGKIFDGVTRSVVSPATNANLKAVITYSRWGAVVSRNALFDTYGNYYFNNIPYDTPYTIEVSAGTSFLPFLYQSAGQSWTNALTVASQGAGLEIYPYYIKTNYAVNGNMSLFPADLHPGSVTIQIVGSTGGLATTPIQSTGVVVLKPSITAGEYPGSLGETPGMATVFTNAYDTWAAGNRKNLAADGTVIYTAQELTLGGAYTINVYGVSGYTLTTAVPVTFNTTSDTTVYVQLTKVLAGAPKVVTRSDYNGDQQVPVTTVADPLTAKIILTFDREIELDPNSVYLAQISSVVASDIGISPITLGVAAPFNGSAITDTPSNHLTVALADADGNVPVTPLAHSNKLAISTIPTTYLENTSDIATPVVADSADFNVVINIALTSIGVREYGNETFYTLDAVDWSACFKNAGTDLMVIVRDLTVLE